MLGYDVSPVMGLCSGSANRIVRDRAVARAVVFRWRINGRAVELVNGHESLLVLSSRGALSMPA